MGLNIEEVLEELQIPDYRTTHISREDIQNDLVTRLKQLEDLEYLGRVLRSNLYAEARKCGISKRDLQEARARQAAKSIGGTLADHLSGQDLRRR